MVINKDKWFQKQVIKRYKDGCEEIFIDGNLTTPPCQINNETRFNESQNLKFPDYVAQT